MCRYSVVPKTKKVVDDIDKFVKENHRRESGIIYCLSRNDCERVCEKLRVRFHRFGSTLAAVSKCGVFKWMDIFTSA